MKKKKKGAGRAQHSLHVEAEGTEGRGGRLSGKENLCVSVYHINTFTWSHALSEVFVFSCTTALMHFDRIFCSASRVFREKVFMGYYCSSEEFD